MSSVLIRYVLKAAMRDRLFLTLIAALLTGASLAVFLGSSSVIEKNEFAKVFMGAGLRVTVALGLILFVVFHVRRSFEARDVEFLLSRPVSRAGFLLSFAGAFSLLAVVAGLAEGLCVGALTPHFINPGLMLWLASVIIENIIIVNVAFFFSMIISSAASGAMATLGFYVLTRMMGEILGIIMTGTELPWAKPLALIMQAISMLLPRLDLMGQTSWLIYGPDASAGYVFLISQGAVYTALILCAAMLDLARRKF